MHDLATCEICVIIMLGHMKTDERTSTMTKVLDVPMLADCLFSARAEAMKGKVMQF